MSATATTKGLLGTKLGMTQVWDENNKLVPVTVVSISPNVVTQVRNVEKDGYAAVQIAYGQIDPRKVNKPAAGHFEKRTHKRLIDIIDPTPKAVDSLMRLDLPADVNLEIKA